MKIQDAIKQAGEGGKIFKREWTASGRLGVFKDCNDVWKWVSNGEDFRPSMNIMLADDWEVVAPDIEVGDVVAHKNCQGDKCEVMKINDEIACVMQISSTVCACDSGIEYFTFIRKGDKKIVVKGCTAWKESNKRFASLLIEGVELKEGSKYTAVLTEETE